MGDRHHHHHLHDHAGGHDHDHGEGEDVPPGISRRTLLGGLGAGALGLLLPALGVATMPGGLTTPLVASAATRNRYRLAMHVHTCFSEGVGSMYAALEEARRTGHDLLYFTEHDHRKKGTTQRRGIHFTGTSEAESGVGTWTWASRTEGSFASRSQNWVANPSSPVEPGHALEIAVTASGSGTAYNLFDGNDGSSGKAVRFNVIGQRLFVDVRVDQPSANAWLELRLYLSYYPALGGQSAGYRTLSYRFGDQTGRQRDSSNGLLGIVWKQVPVATWTTVELRPHEDISAIFTELPIPGDNHTTGRQNGNNVVMTVGAGARNGATARGWLDRLRWERDNLGAAAYDLQEQLIQQYGPIFPTVKMALGDEIGTGLPHLIWVTGRATPIAYNEGNWGQSAVVTQVINAVHAAGAVLQYNHPFGAEASGSFTNQTTLLNQARSGLKNTGAWPLIDLLECGYQRRGTNTDMASLDTHLRLLDLMARAGRFVTATGVNDDHEGLVGSWSTRSNRFTTGIWAPSLSDGDVKDALLSGQAYCVELETSGTVEQLDITADDIVPMGAVSVAQRVSRTVQVSCPTLPSGATAELVTGPVDYVDTDLTNRTTTFATATRSELQAGTVSRSVDTSSNCFVRVQIRNSGGTIVAFSNPIWLLRSQPPGGIPARRLAPDVPPPTGSSTSSSSIPSTTGSGTTIPPGSEPNSVVTTPTPGSTVAGAVAITGTASGNPGVKLVGYAIRNQSTKLWLRPDGVSWGTYYLFPATLGSPGAPNTPWSATRTLPAASYGMEVRATDNNDRNETTKPWVLFSVSTSGTTTTTTPSTTPTTTGADVEPNTIVTTPVAGASVSSPVLISGTASDNGGVKFVRYAIRNQVTRLWLRPDGVSWGSYHLFDTTLGSPGAATTTWSTTRTLPAGSYGMEVRATDNNDRHETSKPWVLYTVR